MDDQHSDYDNFSDGEGVNPGLRSSLSKIPNSTLKCLNYTTNYVRKWGLEEAFRETYQNWRDGILKSFNLNLSQFRTVSKEVGKVILVKAFKLDETRLLGFIRFQWDKNGECVGGLKIANFNATLPYKSLGTGGTSKASDHGQTGQRGEGMKLSALVFHRNDYRFYIESGSFKWNFIFKNEELVCGLRRMTNKQLEKLKQKEDGQPRTEVARPWEDVCVVIGAPGNIRKTNGYIIKGARLHVDDFRAMLKVTIDINPPKKMIRTPHGDLIRDPAYQSHMYLRGLLLPSGGTRGKTYTYGYNFVDGNTTRDRSALLGSEEESKRIAAIWASAIRADDSDDADMVTEYTNLLLNSLNNRGDVILSSDASNCLKKDVATRVWKKMLTMNHNQQGRPAFYYSAIEGKDEVHIIEQSLNNNPIPLDLEMWKILRKYDLCRTPVEELSHRFKFAKTITIPNHYFAANVDRMLRCLLQSSQATKYMEVVFVDGESLRIDAGFFGTTWRIHNRWLTYEGAHGNVFCEERASDHQHPFVCDHVVLQLWDIMISQLMATGEHPRIIDEEAWLKSMARARLSQMPRSVTCCDTIRRNELSVYWDSVDSHQNKDKKVKIVLHVDGCTNNSEPHCQPRKVLLHLSDQERKCTCPSQVSYAVNHSGTVFSNLDPTKGYFPSISRDTVGAFVALQPKSAKPLIEDRTFVPAPEAESLSPSVIGDQIQHKSLDWGGSFPGSHAFYRTRDILNKDVFILKPRQQPQNGNTKRKADEEMSAPTSKARCFQTYVCDGSEEVSERGATLPDETSSFLNASRETHSLSMGHGAKSMTREAAASMTPIPAGGITYRY